jgi:hypothetical protein
LQFDGEQPDNPLSPSSDALEPGTCLGRWLLLRLIGRGGMGEVYEAGHALTLTSA